MLEQLTALAEDPILGLSQAFAADNNPLKVDLGIGIYRNEQGETPIMSAVQEAQTLWHQSEQSKSYLPAGGISGFNSGIAELLLGREHEAIQAQRIACVQTPGGCGANRLAAELAQRCKPNTKIWLPTPSWLNHFPLLGGAGLAIEEYTYYDKVNCTVDFASMMATLENAQPGDLLLLHGCCHNPTGADLSRKQWQVLATKCKQCKLTPFVDIAYQGLADGLDDDAWGVRHLVEELDEVFLAYSCSKNFGLYRERVGAVLIATANRRQAEICRSQLIGIAREIYSMPPSHGAAVVDIILHDPVLQVSWRNELNQMRDRIKHLRETFYRQTKTAGMGERFAFITRENGLFSALGLTPEQVNQLKNKYSIYMVNSSRINIAGLNQRNIDYVVEALNGL